MTETVSASKKLGREDALRLIEGAKTVHVANGKKVTSFEVAASDVEEILTNMLGRTQNLRAPIMKMGKILYVGFPKDGFDMMPK